MLVTALLVLLAACGTARSTHSGESAVDAVLGRDTSGPGTVAGNPECSLSLQITAGSRAREYGSLDELAADSTDIVVVETVGGPARDRLVPGRPTVTVASQDAWVGPVANPGDFVTVRVSRVISGSDLRAGQRISVLPFGSDRVTGHEALHDPGTYLLFLAPYVLGRNRPVGGYVVVGGPAGMFYRCAALSNPDAPFTRTDAETPGLPDEVLPGDVPDAGWTSADYIAVGGPPVQ